MRKVIHRVAKKLEVSKQSVMRWRVNELVKPRPEKKKNSQSKTRVRRIVSLCYLKLAALCGKSFAFPLLIFPVRIKDPSKHLHVRFAEKIFEMAKVKLKPGFERK
ncbi:hypothetical protein LEP1GSC062_3586 [Leptospira alexanderi serovar Manhao 3 str. L 60]|uniref:Uncharacterized protein n=1 Tax=Leptospira alexanderi serovar Manhao 3 str. L 60 TaxID=1049759 RepID=V6IF59_9LEPT|nr:hypothetical protein LEP1GSC062_3586 [Leptospira alexanderi serovar Manhao 3 str. L 60]